MEETVNIMLWKEGKRLVSLSQATDMHPVDVAIRRDGVRRVVRVVRVDERRGSETRRTEKRAERHFESISS